MTAESSPSPSSPLAAPQTARQSPPAPQGTSPQSSEPQRSSPAPQSQHPGALHPSGSQTSGGAQAASPSLGDGVKAQPVPPSFKPVPPSSQPAPPSSQPAPPTAGQPLPVEPKSPSSPVPATTAPPRQAGGKAGGQIQLKTEQGRLRLHIPPPNVTPIEWPELWQQLQHRLDAGKRFWTTRTAIEIVVGDRLLDQRQLQQLAASLAAVNLHVERIHTIRRQTAVAAVTAGYSVEQQVDIVPLSQSPIAKFKSSEAAASSVAEPLYLQTTLRSGSEIRHPGTIVVLGDLNPGSTVIANDDIMVWGRLRGIAHAGAEGNRKCRIMALQMEPTQLRIADLVARAPEQPPTQYSPEVAHIAEGRIQITQAAEFAKNAAPPLAQLRNKA